MNANQQPDPFEALDKWLDKMEDIAEETKPLAAKGKELPLLYMATGFPLKYRIHWDRPDDEDWRRQFEKGITKVKAGGILSLIGPRGSGKTQLSAEIAKETFKGDSRYLTAMSLFLRLRESFRPDSGQSEKQVTDELVKSKLLVLDEIQERGESAWEDRVLTYLIDKRYGDMLPTILIANLTKKELAGTLGPSITDRMHEEGGVIEMLSKSHRRS